MEDTACKKICSKGKNIDDMKALNVEFEKGI